MQSLKQYILFLAISFSAMSAASINENDLLWRLDHLPDEACNKTPLAGTEPTENKLIFQDFRQTSTFLKTLGEFTYSFDKQYLLALADGIEKSSEKDLISIFFMNALEPYLKTFGYPEVKRRYVDVALENLTCLNKQFGIRDLASLSNIQIFQEAAVKLLIQSFTSSRSLLSENLRARTEKLIGVMGNCLAAGIHSTTLATLKQQSSEFEAVNKEQLGNPFLRSRSASDLIVIKYLLAN